MVRIARARISPILVAILALFTLCRASSEGADQLPPVRTEVKFQEPKEKRSDDPEDAWAEWGETEKTRKNPFPKRQREIGVGMDINSILGMAMKQPKVVTAILAAQYSPTDRMGDLVTQKFRNQMAAAGIGCRLWYVHEKGRQVVANCESIRDGHQAKDYMVRQPEIVRTVLDNVAFTPRPYSDDDDDDDDEDEDEADASQRLTQSPAPVAESAEGQTQQNADAPPDSEAAPQAETAKEDL